VGAGVQPETRYAWLGRDRIAYQVMGQGPPDLVATPGSSTHVDLLWEDPAAAVFLRRLASFSRASGAKGCVLTTRPQPAQAHDVVAMAS
jgi:hypothetical protein